MQSPLLVRAEENENFEKAFDEQANKNANGAN